MPRASSVAQGCCSAPRCHGAAAAAAALVVLTFRAAPAVALKRHVDIEETWSGVSLLGLSEADELGAEAAVEQGLDPKCMNPPWTTCVNELIEWRSGDIVPLCEKQILRCIRQADKADASAQGSVSRKSYEIERPCCEDLVGLDEVVRKEVFEVPDDLTSRVNYFCTHTLPPKLYGTIEVCKERPIQVIEKVSRACDDMVARREFSQSGRPKYCDEAAVLKNVLSQARQEARLQRLERASKGVQAADR